MARKMTPQKLEEEYRRKRQSENEVLTHLKDRGPQSYNPLYVWFDPHRTANIQTILYDLTMWDLITIEKDTHRTVTITDQGLARLGEDARQRKTGKSLLS